MCGIVAFFSRQKPISVQPLKSAPESLRHRGPDARGAWVSSNRRVALGHTRLSIIDLETGDQPITNETGRIHIIANGEFYDFERQRSELESLGHVFRTRSDSEIALHLFEEFGTHCVQQLRGEFAFVLWDDLNQMLFAARDRFGIKPLYYAVHDDTMYLASEIKALFAAGVPARWGHECFYQYTTGPLMPDRTLFDGVFQVPPGHFLTATMSGMRTSRYWDFYYSRADELAASTKSESSYIEEFSSVFQEALRLRMRADVPVGCYLSGGLDSCSILGFASRLSRSPIEAFTLTFDQAAYENRPSASGVAELLASALRKVWDVNPNSIPARSTLQRNAAAGTFDLLGRDISQVLHDTAFGVARNHTIENAIDSNGRQEQLDTLLLLVMQKLVVKGDLYFAWNVLLVRLMHDMLSPFIVYQRRAFESRCSAVA